MRQGDYVFDKNAHTKEPWLLTPKDKTHMYGLGKVWTPNGPGHGAVADFRNPLDAKRSAVCVNACAGIKNPEALPDVVEALKIAFRLVPNARGAELARLNGNEWELKNHEKQLEADIKLMTEALAKLEGKA